MCQFGDGVKNGNFIQIRDREKRHHQLKEKALCEVTLTQSFQMKTMISPSPKKSISQPRTAQKYPQN